MTQTREIQIPADLLLAVFPPAIRDEVPPISMSELAIDAIRVAEARGELGRTQRLTAIHSHDFDCTVGEDGECAECHVYHGDPCPSCGQRAYHADGCAAISDEDIRTAACDCSNGVRREGRESWVCTDCDGTGEVRYCHHCGEIVGDATECAACKEEG